MNIDIQNCAETLTEFQRLINSCEFYAVDQEMTGINVAGNSDTFDMTVAESFPSKAAAAERFCAFQYGVCLFHRVEGSDSGIGSGTKYEVRPFNFLIRSHRSIDTISISVSALKFLLTHNMNFQTWLTMGMPYHTDAEWKAMEKKLLPPCPATQKLSEEEVNWLKTAYDHVLNLEEGKDVVLPPTVGTQSPLYLHYMVYHTVPEMLPDPGSSSVVDNSNDNKGLPVPLTRLPVTMSPTLDGSIYVATGTQITVKKLPETDFAVIAAAYAQTKVTTLLREKGFYSFFRAIVDSKKPQLGHNYISDLMFQLNQHHAKLTNYINFKNDVAALFPILYDTKTLVRAVPPKEAFPVSHLGAAFQESTKRVMLQHPATAPRWVFPLGFERYSPTILGPGQGAHDASYDAYMTGVLFTNLVHLYGTPTMERYEGAISVYNNVYVMNTRTNEDIYQPNLVVYAIYDIVDTNTTAKLLSDIRQLPGVMATVLKNIIIAGDYTGVLTLSELENIVKKDAKVSDFTEWKLRQ